MPFSVESMLDSMELKRVSNSVVNLSSKKHLKDYELLGEKIGNVCVYGVWGRKRDIQDLYENLKIDLNKDCFNVFVLHQAVSSIKESEMFADIVTELLPKGFNYYAGGHWHGREELTYNNKPLIYPCCNPQRS